MRDLSWTWKVLSKAWGILIAFIGQDEHQIRLALFIDGLDEFEGLDTEIASLFIAAADSPNIKVCGSSRSHVAFESAFATRPSLRLQDLTHNDIRMYVDERLYENERMQDYVRREPTESQQLVEEIVAAADGVFLWVYLVVTSLIRGLGNGDKISDLRRKLRLLPQDLKQLYVHILTKVDEDYKDEAVNFFQLLNATIPLDSDWKELAISPGRSHAPFSDVQPMKIVAICLAEEPEETLPAIVDPLVTPSASLRHHCRVMSQRLRSRTGGLIDVQLRGARLENISPWTEVEYFHRTVRDFLDSQELKEILQGELSFEADYAMLKACVFELRLRGRDREFPIGRYDQLLNSALLYARRVQSRERHTCSPIPLLEDIYKEPLCRQEEEYGSMDKFQEDSSYEEFLRRAVRYGLHCVIRERANDTRIFTSSFKRELLRISLGLTQSSTLLSPKLILALLSVGADPFASELDPTQSGFRDMPGEALEAHRLMVFQAIITHLRHRPTHCQQPSTRTKKEKGEEGGGSLQDWAEVLRYFLTPRYSSMWKHKPPEICDGFSEVSEIITYRFQSLPEVNAELQGLLVVASYELGYENIKDSPYVPGMCIKVTFQRLWGVLFCLIWLLCCLVCLLYCLIWLAMFSLADTKKYEPYQVLVDACPKRSMHGLFEDLYTCNIYNK